ncbi:MAG: hypothetical protein V7K67_15460 [Nostoc sp.]|uniref:hypothetical protein n=1 Tax=Nostoc sp. TaxID=1180 RepID=UPI002FF78057
MKQPMTVRELIETLQGFPADAEIAMEDLDDDQEFFIVGVNPGDGRVTIVITDELEEGDEG